MIIMAAPTLSEATDIDERTKMRILIVECYWFYKRSYQSVQHRFKELFGRAHPPTRDLIRNTVIRFHDNGIITQVKRSGRPKSATDDDSIELVRDFFEENRSYSIRRASLELGMKRSSVNFILKKKIKSFPYKIQMFQQMTQFDMDRRDQFAFRMQRWIERGKLDTNKIWFSDESHFWLNGFVNKQNYRFWGTENPRIFETTSMKPERITVWCAMSAKGIIGPFFFDENVNSERYLEMLETEFIPLASGLDAIEDFWFMQDGARPHRTKEVFNSLDEHFHGRVIGLDYETRFGCGIEWPPYSPDLNPCDFYLWGTLKERVYRQRPRSIESLKTNITEEIFKIKAEECKRVIGSFEKRLKLVQENEGSHIEQYVH